MLLKKKVYSVNIRFLRNNSIITIQENFSKTLKSISIGTLGFKNSIKSSEIAHLALVNYLIKELINQNIKEITLILNGNKKYRHLYIKKIRYSRVITIKLIIDATPILHNGCKTTKKRKL